MFPPEEGREDGNLPVIGNLEARRSCRSNSTAETGKLVSSEGVGLACVDYFLDVLTSDGAGTRCR